MLQVSYQNNPSLLITDHPILDGPDCYSPVNWLSLVVNPILGVTKVASNLCSFNLSTCQRLGEMTSVFLLIVSYPTIDILQDQRCMTSLLFTAGYYSGFCQVPESKCCGRTVRHSSTRLPKCLLHRQIRFLWTIRSCSLSMGHLKSSHNSNLSTKLNAVFFENFRTYRRMKLSTLECCYLGSLSVRMYVSMVSRLDSRKGTVSEICAISASH